MDPGLSVAGTTRVALFGRRRTLRPAASARSGGGVAALPTRETPGGEAALAGIDERTGRTQEGETSVLRTLWPSQSLRRPQGPKYGRSSPLRPSSWPPPPQQLPRPEPPTAPSAARCTTSPPDPAAHPVAHRRWSCEQRGEGLLGKVEWTLLGTRTRDEFLRPAEPRPVPGPRDRSLPCPRRRRPRQRRRAGPGPGRGPRRRRPGRAARVQGGSSAPVPPAGRGLRQQLPGDRGPRGRAGRRRGGQLRGQQRHGGPGLRVHERRGAGLRHRPRVRPPGPAVLGPVLPQLPQRRRGRRQRSRSHRPERRPGQPVRQRPARHRLPLGVVRRGRDRPERGHLRRLRRGHGPGGVDPRAHRQRRRPAHLLPGGR